MSRRAILIANGNYDHHRLRDLPPPAGDLEALVTVLGDSERGQFAVTDFLDKPSWELRPYLQATLQEAEPDDTILVYFSGHGIRLPDRGDGKLFLATCDTN